MYHLGRHGYKNSRLISAAGQQEPGSPLTVPWAEWIKDKAIIVKECIVAARDVGCKGRPGPGQGPELAGKFGLKEDSQD